MKRIFVAILILTPTLASAKHLSNHGVWSAHKEAGVCYAAAQPEKSEGKYTSRGDVFLTVSFRPQDNVKGEVSTRIGYTFKKDSMPQVSIDKDKNYEFFAKGDAAWTHSDKAVVSAMKKGGKMVVVGYSSRGTKTTDTYSLKGFTAAYTKAQKSCKM